MNAKSLIGGIIAGAAVGVAIGMLFAPASGAKTQQRIIKGARKIGHNLMETAEDSVSSLKDKYNTLISGAAKKSKSGIDIAAETIKA